MFAVESEDEDDEVEFASVPPAASRPPLKAQQVTSSSAHSLPSSGVSVSNRQKRLDEFRQRRAAKKLAEAPKPPPFKVGVYKLEKSIKPGELYSSIIISKWDLRVLNGYGTLFNGTLSLQVLDLLGSQGSPRRVE